MITLYTLEQYASCTLLVLVTPQQTQNICIRFIQNRPNVFDVGPALYECWKNYLCLLGHKHKKLI